MKTNNNNEKNVYGIEKFEGTFDKEELGVTIIPTKTINDIKNAEALGLYVYLLGRPNGWHINVKQLKEHFQCGSDKMYQLLNYLLDRGLISKTILRENGQFSKTHYRVHLHQLTQSQNSSYNEINSSKTYAGIDVLPLRDLPDTVTPYTVNQDAYKTYNIKSIDNKNTPIVPKGTVCADFSNLKNNAYNEKPSLPLICAFALFWSLYPIKKAKKQCEAKWKRMNLDKQVNEIVQALKNQIANDDQWKRGFIPHPLTYINGELWNDDVVKTKGNGKPKAKINCI